MGPQKRYGCNAGHDYRPAETFRPANGTGIARAVRAIDAIAEIGNRSPEEIRLCILALRNLDAADFDTAMRLSEIDTLGD